MKPVKVEWIDSCYTAGWHSKESLKNEPDECFSYGLLVKSNRKAVTLIQTESGKSYTEALTIPRSVIKKITELKE